MKSIKSLEEAQQAINELQNRIDLISSKNWDFHQRRIVNAHPSVDPYDYVVRKELDQIGGKSSEIIDQGLGYKDCVFGLGIAGNIVVGTDVCPHFISAYVLQPEICVAKVKVAPQGAAIQIQCYQNGVTPIFTTVLSLPAASTAVVQKLDFAIKRIEFKDFITCSVLQTGTTVLGQTATVYIRFKILAVPNG